VFAECHAAHLQSVRLSATARTHGTLHANDIAADVPGGALKTSARTATFVLEDNKCNWDICGQK